MTAEDIQRALGDYMANRDIWLKERMEMFRTFEDHASRIAKIELGFEALKGRIIGAVAVISMLFGALGLKLFETWVK